MLHHRRHVFHFVILQISLSRLLKPHLYGMKDLNVIESDAAAGEPGKYRR